MAKIINTTGSPVENENFVGREKELDFAWKHIQGGNSLILASPRRVGKSSFSKKLLAIAKEQDWNTLEIDLEQIQTEEAFVRLFIEKLENQSWWQKGKAKLGKSIDQVLKSIKPSIEYEGTTTTIEWQIQKEDIYEKLKNLLDHEKETLIMVDELTILLNAFVKDKENGLRNAEFFLNWLRSFRQKSGTKIRWIFCSSVSLDNFTNRHRLGHTRNDITPFSLGAYDKTTALRLLKGLAENDNLPIDDAIMERMLEKITWFLPYFLQILHFKFNYLVKVEDEPVAIETVDKAYRLLTQENHLDTWDERMKEYDDLESNARKMLKHISKNPNGESRENLISLLNKTINDAEIAEEIVGKLLRMLLNDGYLMENNEKYVFRSSLLRDYWYFKFVR
jgi:hypothetical protein